MQQQQLDGLRNLQRATAGHSYCRQSASEWPRKHSRCKSSRGRTLRKGRLGPAHRLVVSAQTPAQPGLLSGLFDAIRENLQQSVQPQLQPASLSVESLTYHPPGAASPLLNDVNLQLMAGRMGLVYGRSGAGKSTLLQIVAGLAQPTSGRVDVIAAGTQRQAEPMSRSQLAKRTGLVFQFPERHFLGSTIYDEVTFAWPADPWQRQAVSMELANVLEAVDLGHVSLKTPLRQLSDGYKRRVALAVQLARKPSLLLLDEPLAGLDWQARGDVARVLGKLKERCTVLAVSHDLRELVPLVDQAWKMEPGGLLQPSEWPPPSH